MIDWKEGGWEVIIGAKRLDRDNLNITLQIANCRQYYASVKASFDAKSYSLRVYHVPSFPLEAKLSMNFYTTVAHFR